MPTRPRLGRRSDIWSGRAGGVGPVRCDAAEQGFTSRGTRPIHALPDGASPSGKATDFDSVMRRFESSRPSQEIAHINILLTYISPGLERGTRRGSQKTRAKIELSPGSWLPYQPRPTEFARGNRFVELVGARGMARF